GVGAAHAGPSWSPPAKGLVPLADPEPTCPDCLSYDFLDLQYGFDDYETPFFDNGHRYGLGFSKSIGCNFFVTGAFDFGGYDYDWDGHIVDVEQRRFRLGAGARASLAKCVDLTFEAGAEHFDAEYEGYADHDYDSWAYYAGPGIRARAGKFEFFANAFYFGREGDLSRYYLTHHTHHGGDPHYSGWRVTPGVIFHATDAIGLKISADLERYYRTVWLGARIHY
ncbi:MAG: hypothetical protein AAF236_09315, partial [Verrucomicrobiota bacterium]